MCHSSWIGGVCLPSACFKPGQHGRKVTSAAVFVFDKASVQIGGGLSQRGISVNRFGGLLLQAQIFEH